MHLWIAKGHDLAEVFAEPLLMDRSQNVRTNRLCRGELKEGIQQTQGFLADIDVIVRAESPDKIGKRKL
jgi:hypothetical protein